MASPPSPEDNAEGEEDVGVAEEPCGVFSRRREGDGPGMGLCRDVEDDEGAEW